MSTLELVSLIASIASLVLAVGAIWLSVVFYKMSVAASNATTEAAKGIGASVERLEKLFDKLYSDTFSMMRDTVSDMRRHMWPADATEGDKTIEEAEKKADEKIESLKNTFDIQLSEILERQKGSESQVASIRDEMRKLLDRAIKGSRQADTIALEETIREHILRLLRSSSARNGIRLSDIVERFGLPPNRIFAELDRLQSEGLVMLSSSEISPDTEIRLRNHASTREMPRR